MLFWSFDHFGNSSRAALLHLRPRPIIVFILFLFFLQIPKVIGYDMDYTLIDYNMIHIEERVYHYSKEFPQLTVRLGEVDRWRYHHRGLLKGDILRYFCGCKKWITRKKVKK